jgi:hypothetical protein
VAGHGGGVHRVLVVRADDLRRDVDRHVAFGFGRHLCLGAALARLETRVAFEELLKRFPEFDFDASGVERYYSGNVRGLSRLPLVVERRLARPHKAVCITADDTFGVPCLHFG